MPMNVAWPAVSLGSVIALVVLLLAIVFVVMGKLPLLDGTLLGMLALARLT